MKFIIPLLIAALFILELGCIYTDFSNARSEYERNQINFACEDCIETPADWFLLREGEIND
jgi:hypothetical protein